MRNVIGLIQLVKLHILLFVDVFFPCQKSLRRQNHIFDNVTTQKKEGKTKSRKKYNEKKIVL